MDICFCAMFQCHGNLGFKKSLILIVFYYFLESVGSICKSLYCWFCSRNLGKPVYDLYWFYPLNLFAKFQILSISSLLSSVSHSSHAFFLQSNYHLWGLNISRITKIWWNQFLFVLEKVSRCIIGIFHNMKYNLMIGITQICLVVLSLVSVEQRN